MTATIPMRVWHIPQIPMDPFYVDVSNEEEALKIINVLANYDLFQFENKVKPDYCNMSGLEVCVDGEWAEWENEDYDDINDFRLGRAASQGKESTE
ncbi:MAG TPA: hypothetical protein VFU31_29825 [Candidatus Binatia bacterium]|nr:hypothetical protein [Candidatus Binatia bacterium]